MKTSIATSPGAPVRLGLYCSRKDRPVPEYRLTRGLGCWQLVFDGYPGIFRDERGAACIANLLAHPHETISAAQLEEATTALNPHSLAEVVIDEAGRTAIPGAQDVIQELHLSAERVERLRVFYRTKRQLERVIEDPDENPLVRAEAERDLAAVETHLRNHLPTRDNALRCSDRVRQAIHRFVRRLLRAETNPGCAHPALTAFGVHLHHCVLLPSRCASLEERTGTRAFVYHPPAGLTWILSDQRSALAMSPPA
jgi:hypothetical protein